MYRVPVQKYFGQFSVFKSRRSRIKQLLFKIIIKPTMTTNDNIINGVALTEEEQQHKDELIAKIQAGGEVKLDCNLYVDNAAGYLALKKDLILDLGGFEISATGGNNGDTIDVTAGAKVTIRNGKIKGADDQKNAGACIYVGGSKTELVLEDVEISGQRCVYLNNASVKVTIKSGRFASPNDTETVYVEAGGHAEILGGKFSSVVKLMPHSYTLNLKDALVKDKPDANPVNYITVKGGEFVNYNPSDPKTEPEPWRECSFVAERYTTGFYSEGGDTIYTVKINDGVWPEKSDSGAVITWPDKPEDEEPGTGDENHEEKEMTQGEIADAIYENQSEEQKMLPVLNFMFEEEYDGGYPVEQERFRNSVQKEDMFDFRLREEETDGADAEPPVIDEEKEMKI